MPWVAAQLGGARRSPVGQPRRARPPKKHTPCPPPCPLPPQAAINSRYLATNFLRGTSGTELRRAALCAQAAPPSPTAYPPVSPSLASPPTHSTHTAAAAGVPPLTLPDVQQLSARVGAGGRPEVSMAGGPLRFDSLPRSGGRNGSDAEERGAEEGGGSPSQGAREGVARNSSGGRHKSASPSTIPPFLGAEAQQALVALNRNATTPTPPPIIGGPWGGRNATG